MHFSSYFFSPFLLCFPPLSLSVDQLDDDLEMTMVCHRPEGLDQLEAQTNFSKRELQELYRGFKNVHVAHTCNKIIATEYRSTEYSKLPTGVNGCLSLIRLMTFQGCVLPLA